MIETIKMMGKARATSARGRGWRRKEDLVGYAMLLPALVPYLVFALLPIAWLLFYSFQEWNGFTDASWVGLDNYERVARDREWWDAVLTTMLFAGGRLAIEVPLSLALAYAFFRGVRGGGALRTLYFLPHVLPPAIVGIIFAFFLREVGGPANKILEGLGIVAAPVNFLGDAGNALLSLIGVGVWAHIGITTLLFFAGMLTIPRELIESAAVEGAGERATFRYIVFPLLMPVTRIVVLISIIGILRSFDLVKTLTDGGPAGATEVMFTYLYRFFFEPSAVPQIGYAAALSVTASVIVGIVSVAYLRVLRRSER